MCDLLLLSMCKGIGGIEAVILHISSDFMLRLESEVSDEDLVLEGLYNHHEEKSY